MNSPSTLSISKIASANPIKVGQPITYTITLTNNISTGSATGVVITDILPPEVTFQSATSGGVHSNGTVVWNLPGSIPPNGSTQVTVSGLVTNIVPSPARITNTFQASANNANPVAGVMAITVQPGSPASVDLVVDPASISVCGTTVATATVTDSFGNRVPGVSVTMLNSGKVTPLTADSGVTNSAGQFAVQFQGTDAGSTNIGAFANSLSDVAPLTINLPAIPTTLNLIATPNPLTTGGNTALVTATLKDCKNQAVSGATVNFALNNPALATFSGPTSGTTNASGTVTTTLTSNSTPLAGTLTITGTSGSLVRTVSLNVLPPNTPLLTLTKSAKPATGSKVETGGTIVYTLSVANIGTGAAANVVITDDLVSGLTFQSGKIVGGSGPSLSGDVVTFSVANLALNSSATATLSVTVTSAISGTTLSNVAKAKSNGTTVVTSNIVTHTVTTSTLSTGHIIYLPIIYKP